MTEQLDWEHVEDVSDRYSAEEAHHIKLSESVKVSGAFGRVGDPHETAHFVVVTDVTLGQTETCAFRADENGKVQSWGRVTNDGGQLMSYKGIFSWEMVADALAEAASEGRIGS